MRYNLPKLRLLQKITILLLCSSIGFSDELKPGAIELSITNENKAEITFQLSNEISKPISIRIMRKWEREGTHQKIIELVDTSIIVFQPNNKEYSLPLTSGNYVLESCAEGEEVAIKVDKKIINVERNMYIKDGKSFYAKPVIITLEIGYILIKGEIQGNTSIIETAQELWVNKQEKYQSGESYKLKVKNGKIEGKLKEEGDYTIKLLLVKAPVLRQETATAQVEFTPKSFSVKRNASNYLKVKVNPTIKKTKVSSKVAETYLIEKPGSKTYYNLNKLIHNLSPTMTDVLCFYAVEINSGECLLECVKGGTVYRRKICIPPISNVDIERFSEWFDESCKVSYSIAKTGGAGKSNKILHKTYDMRLAGSPDYKDNIPVFADNKKYTLSFEAKRNQNDIYSRFSVDNVGFTVLNLREIAISKKSGKKVNTLDELYDKVITQFDGKSTKGPEGTIILEKSFYVKSFKIDFRADLKFYYDGKNWTELNLEHNSISYKVYQTGVEKGNLLDFFK